MRLATLRRLAAGAALAALGACGGYGAPTAPPTPAPSPTAVPTADPATTVIPGAVTGPTQMTFVGAEPAPGSTISGCGARIGGCAGRVRMTFRIRSPTGGHVLFMRAYLHDTRKTACLTASTGAFDLAAGEPREVELSFDEADDVCAPPSTIADMDAGVEGSIEIASRQEWGIRYAFLP